MKRLLISREDFVNNFADFRPDTNITMIQILELERRGDILIYLEDDRYCCLYDKKLQRDILRVDINGY